MAVVIRKDFEMPPGLLAAQALHTGMEFIRLKIARGDFCFDNVEKEWIVEPYVSVLAVGTFEELVHVQEEAQRAKLPTCAWNDTIVAPVIKGFAPKCLVGIAIGPADADAIKQVCGMLPLY
jgi:peptidyl-tRNA hydrolase